VRTVRHWWNGVSGSPRRRDIYLRTDGRRWEAESREGASDDGTGGRSARRTYATEDEARRVVREWLGTRTDWQDVPP